MKQLKTYLSTIYQITTKCYRYYSTSDIINIIIAIKRKIFHRYSIRLIRIISAYVIILITFGKENRIYQNTTITTAYFF